MRNSITISKNNSNQEVSIFDGPSIKEVPVKVKTKSGKYITDYVDIRDLKIGAKLEGGIVVENPFL